MITQIGIVAGEIWQLLDANDSMAINDIACKLERDKYLVYMSLGWLSREGHILLDREGDDFRVSLRKKREGV